MTSSASARSPYAESHHLVLLEGALPLLLVAAAYALARWLSPLLLGGAFSFLTAAVVAAAALGGRRAGLTATALSVFGALVLFRPGGTGLSAGADLLRLLAFALVGAGISMMGGRSRRLWRETEERARQLRRSEETYRRIVDIAEEGVWSLDAEGQTRYVNRRVTQMLGYAPQQLVGRRFLDLVLPEGREEALRLWEEMQSGKTVQAEMGFLKRDGETLWARLAGTPMPDGDGRAGAVAMLTDLSVQRHDRETLQQNTSLLRAVIDGSADAVFVKDLDGRYLLINPAGARALGRPAAEVVGKTDRELMPAHLADAIATQDRRIVARDAGATFEYTIGEGESARRFSGTGAPYRDFRGRPVGVLGIARDVTERRRVEAERSVLLAETEKARRDAEAANRAKDEFLATLSHELRTPLTSIVGWAKMLRSGQLDAQTTARAIETIDRNARLQTQLIADVLDLSRIVSGKLRLNLRPMELGPVMEAALDTVRPAAEAKGITIRRGIDRLPCTVSGDSDRLQQVVWNLLSNAIKFTPRGGVIEVRLDCRVREAEIFVADTGVGISPELLPHVFERFLQGDASSTRSYGGLGLGLAIVRHMVELHGGRVEAVSPGLGKGATFRVRLPLLLDMPLAVSGFDVDRRRADERDEVPSLPAQNLHGLKVLVVDDEPDARDLVTTILGHGGAQVFAAETSANALEMLGRVRPDVLLSDLEMPDESGYALMKKIRQLPPEQGGRTPAAALTAYARLDDRTRALRAGFQMHIAKPLNPTELTTIVASLAGRLQEA